MNNVTVSSGSSVAEPTGVTAQPYTLARGGGLAVWGTATLARCTIAGNAIDGKTASGRDLAAYGGGLYASGLNLRDCVVSGNTAIGSGAAGGGIYSVGGADHASGYGNDTFLDRCTVSGNLVRASNAYGGGIFTLSGGPLNLATMHIANSTVARNVVEQLPDSNTSYYRGGGVYLGGGSLDVVASTITENAVTGTAATIGGKPNMGGGAATIGNAHTVEYVWLRNSIVVGNTLNGAPEDWFVGSLTEFNSGGYNLVGRIDFSQILVPVPPWMDLSRKHWPKTDDFLNHVLQQVRQEYGSILGGDFGSSFGDMTGTTWYGPSRTWPSEPQNQPWIAFWRELDAKIGSALGMVILGDEFWGTFSTGRLGANLTLAITRVRRTYVPEPYDQTGKPRPGGGLVDCSSIEQ